jgi:hypothetical protein
VLAEMFDFGVVQMPGDVVLRQMVLEVVVHGSAAADRPRAGGAAAGGGASVRRRSHTRGNAVRASRQSPLVGLPGRPARGVPRPRSLTSVSAGAPRGAPPSGAVGAPGARGS